MPEVIVENLSSKAIHCESKIERLLNILVADTEWMKACGGKGKCTTCAAQILRGNENLSDLTEIERRYRTLGKLSDNERLACQCTVEGDIVIAVPDRNKWPHVAYTY